MRFLVDENLSRQLSDLLRSYGHEAEHVGELGLGSASDRETNDLLVGAQQLGELVRVHHLVAEEAELLPHRSALSSPRCDSWNGFKARNPFLSVRGRKTPRNDRNRPTQQPLLRLVFRRFVLVGGNLRGVS